MRVATSTRSGAGAPQTIEALARGAVDFIDKEACSRVNFEAPEPPAAAG